jgi:Skp family chaperone for outer membrane proteins
MKRIGIAVVALVALAGGFGGSMLYKHLEPEPVAAQSPERAKEGIRIAIINLEEASRQSKIFKELKLKWDAAQNDIKRQNDKSKAEYEAKVEAYKRARLRGEEPETLMNQEVEIKSLEEALKAANEEQRNYLARLLDTYQKEVLVEVMRVLDNYVKLVGYDIVLQDYTLSGADADFFSGPAYAQTLMSKPVLHVWSVNDKNQYVTDITQAIIDRLN